MWLREELLKPIWHAFTALDLDYRGKVSKSQLKVLSYNLCTVLKIPHDLGVLEEHFKDDAAGPLSDQGYMPYLNRFILSKACPDFDVVDFHRMCWTMCYKKNIHTQNLLISDDDAFKVWCIFNFLSEDRYPLVIIMEEMEYLLQKLSEALGIGWSEELFADYKLSLRSKSCLTAWELIELVGAAYFSRRLSPRALSMGINDVFTELILDVLKQGYMSKKGHRRKNWTERWFVLRPSSLSYHVSEDQVEKKGDIPLDRGCCVESLPDRDGKKCLFIIKCAEKSFEISASDKRMKQEWVQAIQTCIQLLSLGQVSPHRQARLRRRQLRQRQRVEEDDLSERMKQLQAANDSKQRQLEDMRTKMEEAAAEAALEELRRKKSQSDLHHRYQQDLDREKMVRQQMEEQVAQKSIELQQHLQRVHELEEMYQQLQEAVEDERQAKEDQEAVRRLQARLLEEEAAKRAELEQLHLQQQSALSQTQAENRELMDEQLAKDRDLRAAMQQLERLESERRGALDQCEMLSKKLERAANKTKTWKDKVTKQEGLLRLIQPGDKAPARITNWGPAAFTDSELELRKSTWQERRNQGDPAQ